MSLTPVRIRGKRKAPVTKTPKAIQKLQQQRPTKKAKRSLTAVMATKASADRLGLETLPSEILEKILLYSSNVSLPYASPVIGLKLSERATLVRMFMWAFHETWDQWFGVPMSKTLLHGPPVMGKPQTECFGDHALQTAVLRQPWAKIDLILLAQQTWATNNAYGRWYQHSSPWVDDPDDLCHSHHGGPTHFNAQKCFNLDFEQALKWDPAQVESMPWGTQDIHPKTRVPEELITGPWNEEQLKRLFWLSRGGMLITHKDFPTPSWETKLELLRNAVLNATQPNIIAINCLMGAWCFQDLPMEFVRREMDDLDRRIQWADDTDLMRHILRRTRAALEMYGIDYRHVRRGSI